jgi:hypothetical protein
MNILLDKIKNLNLETTEKEAQILEICAKLNTPIQIAATTKTNYKLKPLLIPHLLEEGIIAPNKLQALANHPICAEFLKKLIEDHSEGATELSPTIQKLLAAGRTFSILAEEDAEAVQDRLNIAKVIELDHEKPSEHRRYVSWIEEIQPEPISWAQANMGRAIEGYEISHILSKLYGN